MRELSIRAIVSVLAVGSLVWFSTSCATRAVRPAGMLTTVSEEEGGSALGTALLYLPNRILDLSEIVRFGANVGPGFGIDVEATHLARAAAMARTSVGVGYQSFRHLPAMASMESYSGVGPVKADASLGPQWHRSFYDVRIEPHIAIVGAHVAIDLMAIVDFFAGLITLDPSSDDYSF